MLRNKSQVLRKQYGAYEFVVQNLVLCMYVLCTVGLCTCFCTYGKNLSGTFLYRSCHVFVLTECHVFVAASTASMPKYGKNTVLAAVPKNLRREKKKEKEGEKKEEKKGRKVMGKCIFFSYDAHSTTINLGHLP